MNIKEKTKKFLEGKEFSQFGTVNEFTKKGITGLFTWYHEGTPFAVKLNDKVDFPRIPFTPDPIERRIKEIKKQIGLKAYYHLVIWLDGEPIEDYYTEKLTLEQITKLKNEKAHEYKQKHPGKPVSTYAEEIY